MFRKTNTYRRSPINTLSICLVAIFYAHLVKVFEAKTIFRVHIDKETGALDVQDGWIRSFMRNGWNAPLAKERIGFDRYRSDPIFVTTHPPAVVGKRFDGSEYDRNIGSIGNGKVEYSQRRNGYQKADLLRKLLMIATNEANRAMYMEPSFRPSHGVVRQKNANQLLIHKHLLQS